MNLKQAYQMVFDDLHEIRTFQGRYDAVNSSSHFMAGIETVMEVIAYRAYDDDFAEKVFNEFCDNMLRSKYNV